MPKPERAVDASKLAELMLQWEKAKRYADSLERDIIHILKPRQKSFTVGNVKAVYYKPRRTVDYQKAANSRYNDDDLANLGYVKTTISYKEACEGLFSGELDTLEQFAKYADDRIVLKLDNSLDD